MATKTKKGAWEVLRLPKLLNNFKLQVILLVAYKSEFQVRPINRNESPKKVTSVSCGSRESSVCVGCVKSNETNRQIP